MKVIISRAYQRYEGIFESTKSNVFPTKTLAVYLSHVPQLEVKKYDPTYTVYQYAQRE